MTRRVSIKDIAEAAGVSHSTVSRALHGTGRMSDETRRRIVALAKEMGYTPDAQARSLVRGRTYTVGVVVTTIADPFVSDVVDGIEHVAQEAGYSVFLSSSHIDPEREMAVVETFRQRRVDAVIVTSSRVGSLYADDLEEFGVPIVLINNQHEGQYLYSVSADEVQGARTATEHLLGLGHQRIGYIGSSFRPVSSRRRQLGYRRALEAHGIPYNSWLQVSPTVKRDVDAGRAGFEALWKHRPTAVFTYNDMTALGVMQAARARGVIIPDDLSLIGFDNIEFTQFVAPTLSTVHQPRKTMGRAAMEMALTLLRGELIEENDILFPCRLVVRESTARPRFRSDDSPQPEARERQSPSSSPDF
ncbi:MAG: LacI family transcriptional regulator [Chloroflexi bacterium]|nr:LacI family transcriptional regulator [Chloroflexota bacterium]